jgi:hypothetical protein
MFQAVAFQVELVLAVVEQVAMRLLGHMLQILAPWAQVVLV